jgi:hypothetical protein
MKNENGENAPEPICERHPYPKLPVQPHGSTAEVRIWRYLFFVAFFHHFQCLRGCLNGCHNADRVIMTTR